MSILLVIMVIFIVNISNNIVIMSMKTFSLDPFASLTEFFFWVELTFALSLTGLLSHLGSNIFQIFARLKT